MKNLLNNTIYSEGKYPIFLFLSSEYMKDLDNSIPYESVQVYPDISMSVNLPLGSLNMSNFSLHSSSVPPSPIKIGDKDLNDVYIESKDHSEYVKFTWYNPSSEEVTRGIIGRIYKNQESDKDLSWIHYISYRDEEGIFKGNILEFCPVLSFLAEESKDFWDTYSNLVFIKPKDDSVDFTWGDIDSSNPGENNPYLFTIIGIGFSQISI